MKEEISKLYNWFKNHPTTTKMMTLTTLYYFGYSVGMRKGYKLSMKSVEKAFGTFFKELEIHHF